jgi:hypothetical protein
MEIPNKKMDFNNQQVVLTVYILSNLVGLLYLFAAIKQPKLARLMFVLLFGWASWINYTTCHQHPEVYSMYAKKSIGIYANFINGWFKGHITILVSCIAIGQSLVAFGMLLKGIWVKLACIGIIVFLIGIAPLGVYSAFPFSIIVSAAAYFIILKDDMGYLWKFKSKS